MRRTTFVLLCLEGALLSFNVAAVAALVPSIANEFVLSQFVVGKIIWIYMLSYGLAALIYGPLVRAIDAKKVELVCLFFFSAANLAAGLSKNIAMLFTARFFMGLFGASVIPLALILIARHTKSESRGRSVGIFFSATFVASLLGLLLSGIMHWRFIFLIPATFGFILWIHVYFYLPPFKEDKGAFKINYLTAFRDKAIVRIFTYIFFISLIYHGIQQWLAVYFSTGFKFSQFLISMLIMLTSLSGVFGEAIGGWLSDVIGRIKTVNLGIIFMIMGAFLLIFKIPLVILAVIMLIWGAGWTFNHAGVSTMLTDLPNEFLNEAASLNSGVRFVSGGIGAALGGFVMQKSFNAGFLIFGFCMLLLLIFSNKLLIVK